MGGGQITWNFQNHWKDFVFYVKKDIVEIKATQWDENKQRIFIQFAIIRMSATITCIWQRLKGRWRREKALSGVKRRLQLCSEYKLLALGSCR